jgi:hypothetical protein
MAARFPETVDDLTAAWFTEVLGRDVAEATVVDRSSGTTGRAVVALRGAAGLPETVFVKLPPFHARQRDLVDRTGMGVAEARFYRDLAGEVPVRVPGVWFADTDGAGYVMVLEDLAASGCTFPRPDDPDIEARAADIVAELSRLHARYWETARFAPGSDLEWLVARGTRGGGGGQSFVHRAVQELGAEMDDTFHRIAELYLAHAEEIVAMWRSGPRTLVHGDDHLGNLFVDTTAGGRTGFLDWAVVCAGPGIRDVSYVLCNSVPVEVRERIERNLVDDYCARLASAGVAYDPTVAWDEHRVHAVYSWVAAATTAGMGSKWQPIHIGMAATRRATAACAHLDSIGIVEERIGLR